MMLSTFNLGAKYPFYTGQYEAKVDPVSNKQLIPAFATNVELIPEKEGYQRYFIKNKNRWDYVIDNTGKEYWDINGKHIISRLGEEIPEGALLEAPVIQPTTEDLAKNARLKRDQLLDGISKRYDRYASESRLGLETVDSIEALDTYAQALRDITTQAGFPTDIDWPTAPV